MEDWNQKATNLIKAALKLAGDLTYEQLREKLAAIGIEETANSISTKINRGTFSFVFFLQVMAALEIRTVRLSEG